MANNEINNGINSGINNGIICLVLTGTMEFWMTFHINWECHHPNWRTPLFFRGVVRYTAKQIISYIIISIITIIIHNTTWWLIPLSKWGITPIISGLSLLIPFITGVISHLLSGMCHQAERNTDVKREKRCNETAMSWQRDAERKGCQERTYDGPMDKTKIGLRYADKKERSRKEMKKSRGFKGKWCHRT